VRFETYRADKKANVAIGNKHRYSAAPGRASSHVIVGFSAFKSRCLYRDGNLGRHP
jgi:hypothetical protein